MPEVQVVHVAFHSVPAFLGALVGGFVLWSDPKMQLINEKIVTTHGNSFGFIDSLPAAISVGAVVGFVLGHLLDRGANG
jgi:hypothetical protein